MKLTELMQIPLRSFTATAFPKMSKASINGDRTAVARLFHTYTGALSFLFAAMGLFAFLTARPLVWLIAGNQYLQTGGEVIAIMQVFALYGMLLPIDRMTGIALDSINRPQVNALKVLYMIIANVIGDLIAVFVFHSLLLVAIGSILFTCIGIFTGMYFLKVQLTVRYLDIYRNGVQFYRSLFQRLSATSFSSTLTYGKS